MDVARECLARGAAHRSDYSSTSIRDHIKFVGVLARELLSNFALKRIAQGFVHIPDI